MFQRFLLALDGSDHSLRAANIAIELAALLHASLDVVSVEETLPRYVAVAEEHTREHQAALGYFHHLQVPIRRRAEARGIQTQGVILSGHEVQALLHYASEHACDLLIIGAQGHSSVWRRYLGSTADKLINHAPCSVLVVRLQADTSHFGRLLVALDGSPLSWRAFQESLSLAKLLHASLHVLSVGERRVTPPGSTGPLGARSSATTGSLWNWGVYIQQIQARAVEQAQQAGLEIETMSREGDVGSALMQLTQEEMNTLLIMGATGHEHPWSPTLGGTVRKVANEGTCSILIIRIMHMQHRVRDVMRTNVATVTEQQPLAEVAHQLIDQGSRLLVVVDTAHRVLGIITLGALFTHSDVLRWLEQNRSAGTGPLEQQMQQMLTTSKKAGDIMNKRPLVVREDVPLEEAAQQMDARRVTRMPVVDAQRKLIGLLDQADLLRYYTDVPAGPDPIDLQANTARSEHKQMVSDATLEQVPIVPRAMPLTDVLPLVQEAPQRRVIVIDETGKAIGIIADSDILVACGFASHRHSLTALVSRFSLKLPEGWERHRTSSGPLMAQEVMRSRLFAVTPSTSIVEAFHLMLAQHIKRLVVVDEQGKPLGLVDRHHLLRSLLKNGSFPH